MVHFDAYSFSRNISRNLIRRSGPWLAGAVCALAMASCMETAAPTRGEGGNTLSTALQVPASFTDVVVAGGLAGPTLMALAPDGRIFVSEQGGKVRVIKNGALLPTPFVTLNVSSAGERGALGIAFDPAFASNQRVYVYYTSSSGPHNRVSRFTANGDVSSGETILLDLPTLSSATNHNGGALQFGLDGKLYVAVGENANGANAQNMGTTLGKMLRINTDGTIPSDNPFFGSATGNNRAIWALGLRNPFTFAIQPGTGRMFINDVGQNTYEEIDDGIKGANYGWPNTEGNTTDPAFKAPFHFYHHNTGGCAITGGDFYNPATPGFPSEYTGDYFFADYCGGWIKRVDLATKAVTNFASGLSSPTDIRTGKDGSLYYLNRGAGAVRKISYASTQVPVLSQHPSNATATVGGSASFTAAATGGAPLAYQWQRNLANIPGATGTTYTLSNLQLADNGAKFRCVVSNSAGSANSNEAVLTVTTNHVPTADITSPAAGSPFSGGQTIAFAGTGTDQEDGALPASAFTWEAKLYHDDGNPHSHPFYGPVSGSKSGSFVIPDQGEMSPNVLYRIFLTVKDAQGLVHKDSSDILPVKATVTLATSPAGLQLKLDAIPVASPSITGVAGMRRTLEAVSPQTSGGKTWVFVSWSQGGSALQTVTWPTAATTFTATFQEAASQTLEAESAFLSGAVQSNLHAGYTGTGFADYINMSNDFVEWTVNAASAGSKTLDFRYGLGAAARSVKITVNGVTVSASLSFPNTGAWTTWKIVSLPVNLNAGSNKVRATAIGTSGPNLDNLTVR
jgi:glucose/arabinose dehydrogenase